ncbi:MAG: GNAT family N-acetyltransferase [Candidatus Hermodarchaeota archaeon]
MNLKLNPLNLKKNPSIWSSLKRELSKKLNSTIKLIFPEIWDNKYYEWFQNVENIAFREELRYSFKEVENRLRNDNLVFLFILSNNKPEAILLGYSFPDDNLKVFFLDTIAIKKYGKGIGILVLKWFIEWLKKENYEFIRVETEEMDEKNILLYNFYKKLGFKLKERNDKGNLTMILEL